jgi:catechol 2,3-dioxygenase-like lactoylglutathione lyase family enzyme
MPSTKTRVNKVATVIIPTADQDKALAFYCDTLGLEKRTDIPFGGQYRWIEVGPEGESTTLALAPPREGDENGNRETGISLQTDDIDGFHAHLRDAGVDVDEQVQRMGGEVPPMFWFRDPEGNTLMVVQ